MWFTLMGGEGTSGAWTWKDYWGLDAAHVVGDPNWSMNVSGTPTTILVDPRTMKVVDIEVGFSGSFTWVENLAQQNKI